MVSCPTGKQIADMARGPFAASPCLHAMSRHYGEQRADRDTACRPSRTVIGRPADFRMPTNADSLGGKRPIRFCCNVFGVRLCGIRPVLPSEYALGVPEQEGSSYSRPTYSSSSSTSDSCSNEFRRLAAASVISDAPGCEVLAVPSEQVVAMLPDPAHSTFDYLGVTEMKVALVGNYTSPVAWREFVQGGVTDCGIFVVSEGRTIEVDDLGPADVDAVVHVWDRPQEPPHTDVIARLHVAPSSNRHETAAPYDPQSPYPHVSHSCIGQMDE
jgi:hypothetical protein